MDVGKTIILLISFGSGFAFLGISLSMIRRTIYLLKYGIRVQGRVIGYYKNPQPESDDLLEVEFNHLGVEHQCRVAHDVRIPKINESVPLICDPDDLKVVCGTSFGQLWASSLMLLIIGSAIVVFGVVVFSGK